MNTATRDLSGLSITRSERIVLLALCVPPLVSIATLLFKYVSSISAEARRQIIEEDRQAAERGRQARAD